MTKLGHETCQIVGSEKFHFDDREIMREALEKLIEDYVPNVKARNQIEIKYAYKTERLARR